MARTCILTNTGKADRIEYDYRNRAVTIPSGSSRTVIMHDRSAERRKRLDTSLQIDIGEDVDEEKLAKDRDLEREIIISKRDEVEKRNEQIRKEAELAEARRQDAAAAKAPAPARTRRKVTIDQMTDPRQLIAYANDPDNYHHNLFVRQARVVLGRDALPSGPVKKIEVIEALQRKVDEE